MNLLTQAPPESISIGGVNFLINSDFRLMIEFETITNEAITPDEKSERILDVINRFFYFKCNVDADEIIKAFLNFYQCGEEIKEAEAGKNESKQPIYSFAIDGALIYSAFLDQYNLDLIRVKHLHWWVFRSLMQSLKEDCEFKKVIGYRTIKITNDMPAEQKKAYRELKRIYRIPDNRSEEEKDSSFAKALDSLF